MAYDPGITEKTVKVHRAKVMRKMGAKFLADLVRFAEQLGIRPQSPKPPYWTKVQYLSRFNSATLG